jgi:glycosyltransferase involved in cell wall biosynthesis
MTRRAPIRVAEILEATTGGTRTHLGHLFDHIDRARFDATLVCSNKRNKHFAADLDRYRQMGVGVEVIAMTRSVNPLRDLVSLVRLYLYLRRHSFHIVHTHSSKAGFLGRLSAWWAGVPVIVHTPHGFAFQDPSTRFARPLFLWAERLVGRLSSALVCVSPSERGVAVAAGVVRPGRAFVVENGVDVAAAERHGRAGDEVRRRLGIEARSKVVGTVSEFRPQKCLDQLIHAAKAVLTARADVTFLIAGEGELAAPLRQLAASLGIEARCKIVPAAGVIWQYYAAMDVFVLASSWEGMPYAVLEAMAVGKPVIATDVAGTRDVVVRGKTGLLVPPGDREALAGAIATLLDDPQRSERMGAEGKARVRDLYRAELTVRRLEAIYAGLHAGVPLHGMNRRQPCRTTTRPGASV